MSVMQTLPMAKIHIRVAQHRMGAPESVVLMTMDITNNFVRSSCHSSTLGGDGRGRGEKGEHA